MRKNKNPPMSPFEKGGLKGDLALVCDLGGTFIKGALVNHVGSVIYLDVIPTEADKGRDNVIRKIIEQQARIFISNSLTKNNISGIAVGCPGPIDFEKGIVSTPPNLPGWYNVPVRDILRKKWEVPVFIENDANAAALGENWLGAGKGVKSMVCITLGTGVGGGIIIDGKIFHGAAGSAGEIGHITIEPAGRECNCGNRGCLERYVGREAIEKEMRRLFKEKGSPEILGRLARAKDKNACALIENIGKKIGIVTADIANFFNPEMIVIGGGIAGLGKELFDAIRSETKKRAFPQATKKLKIVHAKLGENAGLVGLAKIVFGNI